MKCSTRMPMMSSWGYPNSAETWRLANRMTPEASMMIIASGAASSALRANSGGADCMEGGNGSGILAGVRLGRLDPVACLSSAAEDDAVHSRARYLKKEGGPRAT